MYPRDAFVAFDCDRNGLLVGLEWLGLKLDQALLIVFDAWKEMSRPENYVYYNNKIQRSQNTSDQHEQLTTKTEKKWVLLSVLILFVPIFSAELFLALTRQILCGGDPIIQSAWAAELCSPHLP